MLESGFSLFQAEYRKIADDPLKDPDNTIEFAHFYRLYRLRDDPPFKKILTSLMEEIKSEATPRTPSYYHEVGQLAYTGRL
jgi:hypothetical protein